MSYDVSNPHPDYGKDPNIKNEFGHTEYPKWVIGKDGKRVIADNPKHEAELTEGVEQPIINESKVKKQAQWGK